jgi:hypothetical protein
MRLTTQAVQRFKGGQMEIQNRDERYLYRGEIKTIAVVDNGLRVEFAWLAKMRGFPTPPGGDWVNVDPSGPEIRGIRHYLPPYKSGEIAVSLTVCSVIDIGPSGPEIGGDNRLCIDSAISSEVITLYPPNGSKLDPPRVEGLQRA